MNVLSTEIRLLLLFLVLQSSSTVVTSAWAVPRFLVGTHEGKGRGYIN